jgi:IMP dehydrogenase
MKLALCDALTFDDVLLVPKYSTVSSRSSVDMTVDLPKGFKVDSPFMPANMKDVVGKESISIFLDRGCLTFLHRFDDDPVASQSSQLRLVDSASRKNLGCSVGVRDADYGRVDRLIEVGFRSVCIDVAHGYSKACINMVNHVAKNYPNVLLVAGNVATSDAALALWEAGADVVKVGIGPGSICTTRKETGNGVPQLSALENISKAKNDRNWAIISDGGIKASGDCVKALCYADLVMIGGMFASTYEAPGKTVEVTGNSGGWYKEYGGSSTHKNNRIEGTIVMKPIDGRLSDVLDRLTEGVQSGCSYQGCHRVANLKRDPEFVRVSSVQQRLDHGKDTFRR